MYNIINMPECIFTEINSAKFDKFSQKHPLGSMFQDSRWATVKSDNWQNKFIALKSSKKILVASLILVRKLPLGFKMWYLPRGPLFNPKDKTTLPIFTKELLKLARKNHVLLIKCDPNLVINSASFADARAIINQPRKTPYLDVFSKAGWQHTGFSKAMKDTIQPRFDAVLYFDEQTDLITKISKKIRQQIRKWESFGVKTQAIEIDRINDLTKIMNKTAKSKQISLRDSAYFTKLKQAFGDDCLMTITSIDPKQYLAQAQINYDKLKLSSAKNTVNFQRQISSAEKILNDAKNLSQKYTKPANLSASVSILANQEFNMLYAGMDRRFNQFYATHITNLWRAHWAQSHHARRANFSGIDGNLNDSLSEFKSAFGASVDEYIGEFDLYIYPVLSWTFAKLLPKIKKVFLKLKRH